MNKLVLLSLYLMFVIKAVGASAHDIQPAGRLIGHDRQNNAIYQVHANGIDLAYKLVGAGEPLVLITGTRGVMDR